MKRVTSTAVFTLLTAVLTLLALSAQAATVFDTTSTGGNAGDLNGHVSSSSSVLNLSGGGTITLTSVTVNNPGNNPDQLTIANGTMGVTNEKWGTGQMWELSFDQDISFDGFTFDTGLSNSTMTFSSTAWGSDPTGQSGANWSFSSDGSVGTFTFSVTDNSGVTDFTSATLSNVSAGTSMTLAYSGGPTGSGMTSFTLTAIPEPSAVSLLALGGMVLLLRRRA